MSSRNLQRIYVAVFLLTFSLVQPSYPAAAAPKRKVLTGESLLAAVRNVTKTTAGSGKPDHRKITAYEADLPTKSPGIVLQRVTLYPETGVELHGEFATQRFPNAHPAILILTSAASEPADSDAHKTLTAYIQSLAASGNVIFAVTPRSHADTPQLVLKPADLSAPHPEFTGETLMGLRIDDTLYAVTYLTSRSGVDSKRITAQASGHFGPVLLHAAVLDPRLTHVMVDHSLTSYQPPAIVAPEDILPGVLLQYDLPDLVATLGSRVTVLHPDDPSQANAH